MIRKNPGKVDIFLMHHVNNIHVVLPEKPFVNTVNLPMSYTLISLHGLIMVHQMTTYEHLNIVSLTE